MASWRAIVSFGCREICGIRSTPDWRRALTARDPEAIEAALTARQHTRGSTETIGEIVVPAT